MIVRADSQAQALEVARLQEPDYPSEFLCKELLADGDSEVLLVAALSEHRVYGNWRYGGNLPFHLFLRERDEVNVMPVEVSK